MAFNVNDFRSKMIADGARPNLFEVYLTLPPLLKGTVESQMKFKIKAAQLPGSTVGIVPVYYMGRELKFPGNRTFSDWTVQVINDESFNIRNVFESWMSQINSHSENKRNSQFLSPSSYSTDALVQQWGKAGGLLKSYTFQGLFPVDIAPIDLDWGSNDSIEEFSVTFAYQYWTSNTTDGEQSNQKPTVGST